METFEKRAKGGKRVSGYLVEENLGQKILQIQSPDTRLWLAC